MTPASPDPGPDEHFHVVVVGSGFAGIGASIALAEAGIDHVVLERADELGGTWRDNTYPGCRCDVPSHLYSFSFAPNPDWSETYSPQAEIQAYLRRTADDHGVTERIRFRHEVRRASWDARQNRWELDTHGGRLTADILVVGNGFLAEPALPDIPGIESFAGTAFHSARWRHDHDLTGERVAVIGTGASAIQFVPEIQPTVEHLTLYQRTPPWVFPHGNRAITDTERSLFRAIPALQRAIRGTIYWSRELLVTAMLRNGKGIARMEKLARRHLETQVPDPELRARVTPTYRPGCKRLLLSNDYYPTLSEPNVDVVTDAITEIRPDAVVTADGVAHPVDTIIFGTGFHVTDNPIAERIHGREGRSLADGWADTGAQAYVGSTVPKFPNLFFLAGPNTGIGHTSLVVMIEAQIAYVVDAIETMHRTGAASVELRAPALAAWTDTIRRKAAGTVWNSGGCASWYLDAEGRNTTLWPDYTFRFRRGTRRFDPARYELVARAEADSGAVAEPVGSA